VQLILICSASVDKYPGNPMLGRRPVVDGNAGDYAWMTYQEAYDVVMKLAASMNKFGVTQVPSRLDSDQEYGSVWITTSKVLLIWIVSSCTCL
jgi:hypothetical protein